jgi:hypothetical protein
VGSLFLLGLSDGSWDEMESGGGCGRLWSETLGRSVQGQGGKSMSDGYQCHRLVEENGFSDYFYGDPERLE